MNIQISNRHETAHSQVKALIETELESLATRYEIIAADVILDHEGHSIPHVIAEINLKVKGGMLIAKEKSEKVEKSIDLAVRSLEKQLQKHKETHFASQELRRTSAKLKGTEVVDRGDETETDIEVL